MNSNMYENPIVQKHINILKEYGYHFVEPSTGRLACGDYGNGKLAEVDTIVDQIDMYLHKEKDLYGKKILVTAGPTREDIDPVRFITNRSTGKMGYAIARAARNRGAEVILISGPVDLKPPTGIECVVAYSAEDMYNAVIDNFENVDIVIKSAAVADYKPVSKSDIKIKKSDDDLSIELTRSKDILKEVGQKKVSQILIGFAAETNDLIKNAKEKIKKKNLDMIIANDVLSENAGFGVDTNSVKIIDKSGVITDIPNMSKTDVAHVILDAILKIER
jgi:phosphopantothenoylcysteine decarboxylase / phosphopantothenate---cysteine ligase